MKHLLISFFLLFGLAGCSKKAAVAPATPELSMAALVNGQSWQTTAGGKPPMAQINESFTPARNSVFILAGSNKDLTALGIKNCDIILSAGYMPKIGRHAVNSGYAGPVAGSNAKGNYLSIYMQYQRLDGNTYQAFATSGFLEIKQVADKYVAATFEFTAAELTVSGPSGPPIIFTVDKGQFNAMILNTSTLPVTWNESQ